MIDVVKVEPVDEKKEVLQYLKDHREIIAELASCNAEGNDFDIIIRDILISFILDDIETFRQNKGTSVLNDVSKSFIFVISGCDSWMKSYPYIDMASTYLYDETLDVISINHQTFNLYKAISVDKVKSEISKALLDLDPVALFSLYSKFVSDTPLPSHDISPAAIFNHFQPFPVYANLIGKIKSQEQKNPVNEETVE